MSLATSSAKRTTTSIHSKKLVGDHQKKNKSFIKAYWPYLPVLMLAVVVLTFIGGSVLGTSGAVFGGVGGVVATVLIAV